jgi:CO dehydrogenase/acetyl-CoA synthase alpha subunit
MELHEEEMERLIAKIANGETDVNQLQEDELDQLMDYLHERADELIGTEDDEVGQQLLKMLDLIGHVIDNRIEAEDNEKFTKAIQASIQRGNFYFELPTFMLH